MECVHTTPSLANCSYILFIPDQINVYLSVGTAQLCLHSSQSIELRTKQQISRDGRLNILEDTEVDDKVGKEEGRG